MCYVSLELKGAKSITLATTAPVNNGKVRLLVQIFDTVDFTHNTSSSFQSYF